MPEQPHPSSTGDTSASPWLQSSESASLGDPKERVMLLSGQTFCLSDRHGAMSPGLPHGLFIGDTRVLSGLRLTIDGHQPEALGVAEEGGAAASFVGRTGTSVDRRRLLVVRRRKLAPVLCEEIELRSSIAGEIERDGARRRGGRLRRPLLGQAGPPPPARPAPGVRRR